MKPIKFRRAYAQARLNLPLDDDSAESIAAVTAAKNRRKHDGINDSFAFLLDLKGGIKEREKPRKRVKTRYDVDLPDEGVYRRETGASLPDLWADFE